MVAPGAECYMCVQVVDLRQCGTVKSADDLTNKPCSFTVQVPERTFYLVATSEAERNDWVASIGAPMPMPAPSSIARASPNQRAHWISARHPMPIWLAGRATTESRRVRSYSEEVEYQEQQERLAKAQRIAARRNADGLVGS